MSSVLELAKQKTEKPELSGLAERVANTIDLIIECDVLDLSVGTIAAELGFSTRTLQRDLGATGHTFASIRDSYRFHYSVKMLGESDLTIDDISAKLRFSDRTCFANAFNRWMSVSPAKFRTACRENETSLYEKLLQLRTGSAEVEHKILLEQRSDYLKRIELIDQRIAEIGVSLG